MKRLSFCLLAAMGLSLAWSTAAFAQLVQVAPGYVKAPFVRVYTGPGGTYVRAPFVNVQRPGFGRGLPAPDELAQMDWRTLRQALRDVSEGLDDQLSGFSTGNSWKVFLKTAEIRALAGDTDSPPSPDDLRQLQPILAAYEKTNANAAFRNIASLETFQGTYRALVEFAAPPEVRTRQQLLAAAVELRRELERSGADPGWIRHLALPEGLAGDPATSTPPSADALAKTLERYDRVNTNEQYQAIARLPAFQGTHKRLAAYVELAKGPAPGPPAPAEELPLPPLK
jgi:hypothetical protein